MGYYELTVIGRQDLSNAQVDNVIDYVKQRIADLEGTIHKTEQWGLRQFAYQIQKNRKGHYVHMNVEMPGQNVQELKRLLNLHDDLLRHLIVRVERFNQEPSPMMQSRKEDRKREGRSRRGGRGESTKASGE